MDRLLQLLRTHSFQRDRVVLASGRESDFFIDCKQTVLLAEGHFLAAEALIDALGGLPRFPAAVGGVELGGCPLASAVALRSWQRDRPVDAIYVRKAVKDHGSRRALEGDRHLADGTPVAVVEDVLTTGRSSLDAAEKLRERGLDVVGVVALVDREEGGGDALHQAGLSFRAVYHRRDFLFGEGT